MAHVGSSKLSSSNSPVTTGTLAATGAIDVLQQVALSQPLALVVVKRRRLLVERIVGRMVHPLLATVVLAEIVGVVQAAGEDRLSRARLRTAFSRLCSPATW